MEKILMLIRGIPGSGKSTFAKMAIGDDASLVFEADKYFINKNTGKYEWDATKTKQAHEWCRNEVELAMKKSLKLAVSNTFTQEWEMKPYFDLAKKYGYKVFTLIVENRHGGKNVHDVPAEVLDKMRNRFEICL